MTAWQALYVVGWGAGEFQKVYADAVIAGTDKRHVLINEFLSHVGSCVSPAGCGSVAKTINASEHMDI